MNRPMFSLASLAAAALLAGAAAPAHALTLYPGQSVYSEFGVVLNEQPELAGHEYSDIQYSNVIGGEAGALIFGSATPTPRYLISRLVRTDAGQLTFYYTLQESVFPGYGDPGPDFRNGITLSGFEGLDLDVNYEHSGDANSGVAVPFIFQRSADGNDVTIRLPYGSAGYTSTGGSTIPNAPGATLRTFYIRTNAQKFDTNAMLLFATDPEGAVHEAYITAYTPLRGATIPEPASLALLPLAIAGLALRRRR